MPSRFSIISLFCAVLLLCSNTAEAYIGPIIIIGAVGSMFGWVAAVGIAALIVLSYPFYVLYRRKNSRKQGKVEEADAEAGAEAEKVEESSVGA